MVGHAIPEEKAKTETAQPHPQNALSAAFVRQVAEPGRYCDGHGLYLEVHTTGRRNWLQRLVIRRQRCELGLGSYPLVTLKEAGRRRMSRPGTRRSCTLARGLRNRPAADRGLALVHTTLDGLVHELAGGGLGQPTAAAPQRLSAVVADRDAKQPGVPPRHPLQLLRRLEAAPQGGSRCGAALRCRWRRRY